MSAEASAIDCGADIGAHLGMDRFTIWAPHSDGGFSALASIPTPHVWSPGRRGKWCLGFGGFNGSTWFNLHF